MVRGNIDTSTANGRYVRTILLANAERELDEHTERFENLRQWATAAGIWQRRQTPRGYKRDPETRKLVPDEQADAVRRAFRERAAGQTVSHIARDLSMTEAGTRALLGNRVYLGELRVGQHVNPAAHPALITEDEWLGARGAQAPARPARSGEPIALLAGLVRCSSCGHVMCRANGGGKHRIYACHRHHSAGPCPRPTAITLKPLEEYVDQIARQQLGRLQATVVDSDRDVEEARAAARDAELELAAYLEGVSAAGLSPNEYANGARSRRLAVEEARGRLGDLLARRPALVNGDPIEAWEAMSADQRNRLLRSLIECVLVAPVGRGKRVPLTDRIRVVAFGSGVVEDYRGGGTPLPIRQLTLPDLDDPAVLGVHLGEDLLQGAGR